MKDTVLETAIRNYVSAADDQKKLLAAVSDILIWVEIG